MKQNIIAMLAQAVARYGDRHYLTDKTDAGWVGLSYIQVMERVRALAAAYIDCGLTGNTAIIAEGRSAWVISEMATFLGGHCTVPLSIKLQAEEIPYRINHADVHLLVCSRLTVDKVLGVWGSFDHPVLFLYLDSDLESISKISAITGLVRGTGFFTYEELLAQGMRLAATAQWQEKLDFRASEVSDLSPATISYTSGTTGNPKGITLSHKNYFCDVRDSLAAFPLMEGTRMFVVLPIDHAYAHTIALYAPLMKWITLIFVDARGGATGIARNILPNMVETNPHMMLTVPSLTATFMGKIINGVKQKGKFIYWLFERGLSARICMNGTVWQRPAWYKRLLPWFPATIAEVLIFRKVRTLFGNQFGFTIGGGAFLEMKQQEFFRAIGVVVYQGYGLSEASPVVSTNAPHQHKLGTSGRLLPNLECKIIDDHGKELPLGQKGQVCLKGDIIMLGYWKNPEATHEAIRDGWLHTGDLGYLDGDGFLYVVGREKALLIMEDGEKYSPEEIEEAIVACSNGRITQCMLYCDHKKYVSALIVIAPEEYHREIQGQGPGDAVNRILAAVIQDFDAFRKEPTYAGRFPRNWLPRTFRMLEEPFSEPNGMINSTMKMVRRNIVAVHQAEIDYLYTDEGTRPDNQRNRDYLARLLAKAAR